MAFTFLCILWIQFSCSCKIFGCIWLVYKNSWGVIWKSKWPFYMRIERWILIFHLKNNWRNLIIFWRWLSLSETEFIFEFLIRVEFLLIIFKFENVLFFQSIEPIFFGFKYLIKMFKVNSISWRSRGVGFKGVKSGLRLNEKFHFSKRLSITTC